MRLRDSHSWALRSQLALLAAAALSFSAYNAEALAAQSQQPDVRGFALTDAMGTLEDAGYSVELQPQDLPAGSDPSRVIVLEQVAVRDAFGNLVGAVLELGAQVPDVVGLSEAAAVDELTAHGLGSAGSSATSGGSASLLVTEQDPGAGSELALNEPVDLAIAEPVAVPLLLGQSREAASDLLQGSGLQLVVQGEDVGDPVLTQNPPPDTLVAPGSPVLVSLSPGQRDSVVIPDVSGRTQDDARDLLAEVDLTMEAAVEGDPARATAANQDPPAGTVILPPAVVDVSFVGPAVRSQSPPWHLVAIALVALAAVLAATARLQLSARHRRERHWLKANVQYQGDLPPPASARITFEAEAEARTYSLRLHAHPDPGHQELQEERP